MSQRKEKYARSMERRVVDVERKMASLEMEAYRHGVRLAVAEGDLMERMARVSAKAADVREPMYGAGVCDGAECKATTFGRSSKRKDRVRRALLTAAIVIYAILIAVVVAKVVIQEQGQGQKGAGIGVVVVSNQEMAEALGGTGGLWHVQLDKLAGETPGLWRGN